MHMGQEYCGIVIEVCSEIRTVRPGQFAGAELAFEFAEAE
ncbi:hypothetical protein X759_28420 [Mesorhizobium sp. LSHC420B00]|nr:hypothetical protein X759_28420 [Mesorhizobium sp. LSHC420B00]